MSDPAPITILIQARQGSTRLPGKILEELGDTCVLAFLLRRLRGLPWPARVVVATTDLDRDDAVVAVAEQEHTTWSRGSEDDVLGRFVSALEGDAATWAIRVTSDCPLLDLDLLTHLRSFRDANVDYVRLDPKDLPLGLTGELVRVEALRQLAAESRDSEEREHVTLGLYRRPERFRVRTVGPPQGYPLTGSPARLTLDHAEDLTLLRTLVEHLGPGADAASIRALLDRQPELLRINADVEQHYPTGYWSTLEGNSPTEG